MADDPADPPPKKFRPILPKGDGSNQPVVAADKLKLICKWGGIPLTTQELGQPTNGFLIPNTIGRTSSGRRMFVHMKDHLVSYQSHIWTKSYFGLTEKANPLWKDAPDVSGE